MYISNISKINKVILYLIQVFFRDKFFSESVQNVYLFWYYRKYSKRYNYNVAVLYHVNKLK